MTGQHVANQYKLIFSEYGWSETLISDNGPCYTVEAFISVMNAYHVNHNTSSPLYPQSNGLAKKYVQIAKSLFYKAKEEGEDLYKCLMIYLPMSNTVKQQLGLQSVKLRNVNKNDHIPSHDLYIWRDVMYQDATSKQYIQPLLQVYVCKQEVTTSLQGKVSLTGRHKLI